MKVSLIISTYNKYDYLYLVLKSVDEQTYKNFEVIIAEDAEKQEMLDNLEKWKKEFSFEIKHCSHEDIGFRKCKILNKALKVSSGKVVLIIDGDCILHKKYIKNYVALFEKGYDVVFGRRCEMSEELSKRILKKKRIEEINLFNLIFPYSKAWTEAVYIPFFFTLKKRKLRLLGSNMGFTRKIIYEINGFNEDFEGAGIGEDTDLEWRFDKLNVKYKASKNKLIQYHIFHGRTDRAVSNMGKEILERTKMNNEWFTKNGIIKK